MAYTTFLHVLLQEAIALLVSLGIARNTKADIIDWGYEA
jgi:hypothetical protein